MILKQTGKAFSNFALEPSKNRLPTKFHQYSEIQKKMRQKKTRENGTSNQPHIESNQSPYGGAILIQFQVT